MQNKENAKAGIGERFIAGAKSIGKNYQLYLLYFRVCYGTWHSLIGQ